jgi:hypothetical protein
VGRRFTGKARANQRRPMEGRSYSPSIRGNAHIVQRIAEVNGGTWDCRVKSLLLGTEEDSANGLISLFIEAFTIHRL